MHLNFVHNDEIWKDHVHHETSSQLRKWPERWGYLVREYESLNLVLEGKPSLPPLTPPRREVRPGIKLPPIKGGGSTKRPSNFPMSTAQQIGWRVNNVVRDMNSKCDTKTRGQNGMLKLFNWPGEAAP